MKKIFIIITCILSFVIVNAQSNDENCHSIYVDFFKKRGVNPVENGEFDGIVITKKTKNSIHCYAGKANVSKGKITDFHLKFENDTYETKSLLFESEPLEIIEGISAPHKSVDGSEYTVFFTTHVKPKAPAYKLAPHPNDLD